MANYVFIAATLDGFIATPDGGIDWLEDAPNPEGSDFGYSEFVSRVDGILLGRATFEKVLTFEQWPYTKPVFVLTNTLESVPHFLEGKAQIVSGPLADIISSLRLQGFENLYIDGGQVIQSFLREDLIDELIVTRFPKLLGKGIPLFGDLDRIMDFSHVETEVIENYLVKSHYRRERKHKEAQQTSRGNG